MATLIGTVKNIGHEGISIYPIGQDYDEFRTFMSKFDNKLVKLTVMELDIENAPEKKEE